MTRLPTITNKSRFLTGLVCLLMTLFLIGHSVVALTADDRKYLYTPFYDPNSGCDASGFGVRGSKIFVIGDSLTVGMIVEGDLQKKLEADNWTFTGYEAHVGDTVADANKNIDAYADALKQSDTVVVALGTNPENNFSSEATTLISKIRSYTPNAKIYWMNAYTKVLDYTATNGTIASLATSLNYTVIDWFSEVTKNPGPYPFDPSGIHHTPAGYAAKADFLVKSVGATVNIAGGDAPQVAFNYLVSQGLTPFQAAGVVGNMQAESGVEPERLQGTPDKTITPAETLTPSQLNLGWGIVQWTPASKFINPAEASGQNPDELGVQLSFLWTELSSGDEQAAGNALKATTNVDDAATVFLQQYERAATKNDPKEIAMRDSFAEQVLKQYGNGAPSGSSSGSDGCANTTAASSGSYQNPLRDIKDLRPNRIDQGVDYDGSGPVYALGPGHINGIFYNFYAGLPYIAYTLDAGPAQGDTVYFSECISVPNFSPGDKVDSNTVIATMNAAAGSSCHAGVETGWADASHLPNPMAHGVYSEGHATAFGKNFSDLLQSLGAPPGVYEYPSDQGHELGSLPAGWPTWVGQSN